MSSVHKFKKILPVFGRYKLIKHKNIINHIKAQRISWFGHMQRMPDTRTVKMIFK
jgi:hypothetical protein